MNRAEAEKTIDDYEALTAKAVEILNGEGPPWGYVGNAEWAHLTFDGDDAVVSHPDAGTYYDSITIDTDTERFPAALLFMPDAELKAWKVAARKSYDEEQERDRLARIAATDAAERATFEALKRKFETV